MSNLVRFKAYKQNKSLTKQTVKPRFYTATYINLFLLGFSTNITWRTLEEGLVDCNKTKKPMMLMIHKTLCPACDTLKEIFCNSS